MKKFTKKLTLLLALASSTFPAFSAEKGSTNPTGIITFILASASAAWILKTKDTQRVSLAKTKDDLVSFDDQDPEHRKAALQHLETLTAASEDSSKTKPPFCTLS